MQIRVINEHLPLDPAEAIPISENELFALAGGADASHPGEFVYVPRRPIEAAEA